MRGSEFACNQDKNVMLAFKLASVFNFLKLYSYRGLLLFGSSSKTVTEASTSKNGAPAAYIALMPVSASAGFAKLMRRYNFNLSVFANFIQFVIFHVGSELGKTKSAVPPTVFVLASKFLDNAVSNSASKPL